MTAGGNPCSIRLRNLLSHESLDVLSHGRWSRFCRLLVTCSQTFHDRLVQHSIRMNREADWMHIVDLLGKQIEQTEFVVREPLHLPRTAYKAHSPSRFVRVPPIFHGFSLRDKDVVARSRLYEAELGMDSLRIFIKNASVQLITWKKRECHSIGRFGAHPPAQNREIDATKQSRYAETLSTCPVGRGLE